jgi:HSP20 family protein
MTLVIKKRDGSLFPSLVSDFFNAERLFGPGFLDINGGLIDREKAIVLPDANIIENEKDFKIELAAPGLNRDDFKVEIEDGVLCVSAEKEEEQEEDRKNYRRREFSYRSFSRSFTLPENSVSDKIDAKYENGILRVVIPKKEVSVSKPVKEIKVS